MQQLEPRPIQTAPAFLYSQSEHSSSPTEFLSANEERVLSDTDGIPFIPERWALNWWFGVSFLLSLSLSLSHPSLPRSFRVCVCVCVCVCGMWNVRWDVSNFLFLVVKYIPVGFNTVCVWDKERVESGGRQRGMKRTIWPKVSGHHQNIPPPYVLVGRVGPNKIPSADLLL